MKNAQIKAAIPKFALYGESSLNQDAGFVHIEDIAARSGENGWLIKPHRHGKMFQILCIFEGKVEVQLDEVEYSLVGSWAITIPPGVVHGFRFQPNAQGVVLTLAEPLLSNQNSQSSFEPLLDSSQTIQFQKKDVLFNQLTQYFTLIEGEFQRADTDYNMMLEWLVKMVLMTLKRQSENTQLQAHTGSTSSQMLRSFRKLLEGEYKNQWTVQQYATELHTSVSSLNRLCKEAVGFTAKGIIQERVLVEAKRKLIYTRNTLDQTAYTLGFKDPAYFSRFFKRLEGVSPSEYRETNNYETTRS